LIRQPELTEDLTQFLIGSKRSGIFRPIVVLYFTQMLQAVITVANVSLFNNQFY